MRKLGTFILLSLILILLTACGKTSYEIDSEVSVEFAGYDEHGKATVHIDKGKLYENLSEITKLEDRYDVVVLESLIADLLVKAAPTENLKNGDEVKLELFYDDENGLDIELSLKNTEVTVENLEPIQKLTQEDIFAGVEIQFEGVSPLLRGKVIVDSANEVAKLFNYTMSEQRFRIDEEVEITASPKRDLLSSGYEADENDFTKTIQVPKQASYAENWEQLNEEDQKYLLGEIRDIVTAKIDASIQDDMNSIFDQGKHLTTGRFVAENGTSVLEEAHFVYGKEQELEKDYLSIRDDQINGMRLVFKNNITFGESIIKPEINHQKRDYYSIVEVHNIIIDENGNLDRNAVQIKPFSRTDLEKETLINEAITKLVDQYIVDQFKLDGEI